MPHFGFTRTLCWFIDKLWLNLLNNDWGLKDLVISCDAADYLTTSTWLLTSRGLVTDPVTCEWPGSLCSGISAQRRFRVTPVCKETFVVVACGRVVQDRGDPPPGENVSQCAGCSAFHYTPFHVNSALYWSCKLPIPCQRISQAVSSHSLHLDCTHLTWLLCWHGTEDETGCENLQTWSWVRLFASLLQWVKRLACCLLLCWLTAAASRMCQPPEPQPAIV